MKKYLLGALLTFSVAGTQAADLKSQDIVDVAVGAGSFKTLVAAVKAADLVSTLKGDGPFTVFAPTDEAFSKLPKGAAPRESCDTLSPLDPRALVSNGLCIGLPEMSFELRARPKQYHS